MKFVLSEPLHLVIQGEGKNLGKKMILMRLVGCNIQCFDCDTKYTWDPLHWNKKEFRHYKTEQIIKEILNIKNNYNIHHLLITGGEPGLWEQPLYFLIKKLIPFRFKFDLETSGYFALDLIKEFENHIFFNISPKIGDLQSKIKETFEIPILEKKPKNYILKIVVNQNNIKNILDNIKKVQKKYNIPSKKVFLMPLASTREELIQQSEKIINFCFEYGYEFSPRIHILIFDNQRLK